MTDIQLSNDELNIVKNILSDLKNCQVFAFGSRAKNNAKPYSDLDLVIKSDDELDLATMIDLKEQFSNCDLVFKVDICDWHSLDDAFKKSIEDELVVILSSSSQTINKE